MSSPCLECRAVIIQYVFNILQCDSKYDRKWGYSGEQSRCNGSSGTYCLAGQTAVGKELYKYSDTYTMIRSIK